MKLVKVRKERRCSNCGTKIEVGQQAYRYNPPDYEIKPQYYCKKCKNAPKPEADGEPDIDYWNGIYG